MSTGSLFGQLDAVPSAVLFAGLGGACEGIRQATGVSPLAAVNHWDWAIQTHRRNHPETLHFQEDVHTVDPRRATRGRRLRLLWMSPDCTHFSRAKGGKPRDNARRALAEIVFPWARDVAPDVVMLENVPEFEQWGPLDGKGRPIKARRGEHFKRWVRRLEGFGYEVEWRTLVACDYGTPTSRKRLYLIARRDGEPIRWPAPTHGPGLAHPWRTAAECIDWTHPCPSIFLSKEEARALGVRRPLADATLRRIGAGLVKYVTQAGRPGPFITKFYGSAQHGATLDAPLPTVTAGGQRGGGHMGLVVPYLLTTGHTSSSPASKVRPLEEPLTTVVSKAEHCLVVPYLIQSGYGERPGQAPRILDIDAPLGTVVTTGNKHALVAAWLAKHYTGATGSPLSAPVGAITATDHHSLCTAELHPAAQGRARQAADFLCTYYGPSTGLGRGSPLPDIASIVRSGQVTVSVAGQLYVVVDIGMRMLQPRELARASGFTDDYILEGTKREQVAGIGNAVCPQVARALVAANLPEAARAHRGTTRRSPHVGLLGGLTA